MGTLFNLIRKTHVSLRLFELLFDFFHLLLDSLLPPAVNEVNEANAQRRQLMSKREPHKQSDPTRMVIRSGIGAGYVRSY